MKSKPEQKFAFMWRVLGGAAYKAQYKFDASRKWKADFAWPSCKVLVEVEGGQWKIRYSKIRGRSVLVMGGRHNSGTGFEKDAEKYLEATLAGWTVIRLTPAMLTADNLIRINKFIKAREPDQRPDHDALGEP